MAAKPAHVHIDPNSELALRLRAAASGQDPVVVDAGGQLLELRVNPATDAPSRSGPDQKQVERTVAGIRSATGGWRGIVDADALIASIYEHRRIRSRPSVEL